MTQEQYNRYKTAKVGDRLPVKLSCHFVTITGRVGDRLYFLPAHSSNSVPLNVEDLDV
jgi:hypothetical protein